MVTVMITLRLADADAPAMQWTDDNGTPWPAPMHSVRWADAHGTAGPSRTDDRGTHRPSRTDGKGTLSYS